MTILLDCLANAEDSDWEELLLTFCSSPKHGSDGEIHGIVREVLTLESHVLVHPKHLKHVLKLHCNLKALLARGLTIDNIKVQIQTKCCAELGTLLNWLFSLKRIKAPVPALTLCQWFEKIMKMVLLLYVFFCFLFRDDFACWFGLHY